MASYSKWYALLLNYVFPYFKISVEGENSQDSVKHLFSQNILNALVSGRINDCDLPLFKNRYVEANTFIKIVHANF
ncbi:hypothetical protein [Maribacter ulvicola]|uniref:Uncharacterized protein n=1 Tax=Maribacter ulvicola TaxID=228959 RepID=A0A1N6X7A1_9FLAO|nr:hypothetical protein [Maribacter ulvicola]SIQ98234.1 hypothetical protein SAMN05421797_10516 [Maribacter ulvicola]